MEKCERSKNCDPKKNGKKNVITNPTFIWKFEPENLQFCLTKLFMGSYMVCLLVGSCGRCIYVCNINVAFDEFFLSVCLSFSIWSSRSWITHFGWSNICFVFSFFFVRYFVPPHTAENYIFIALNAFFFRSPCASNDFIQWITFLIFYSIVLFCFVLFVDRVSSSKNVLFLIISDHFNVIMIS